VHLITTYNILGLTVCKYWSEIMKSHLSMTFFSINYSCTKCDILRLFIVCVEISNGEIRVHLYNLNPSRYTDVSF